MANGVNFKLPSSTATSHGVGFSLPTYTPEDTAPKGVDLSLTNVEPQVQKTTLGEDYSVSNLAKNQGFIDLLGSYMKSRYGNVDPSKSNEDKVEEYLSHMRYLENNTIDLAQEVDFLKGSDQQTKDQFNLMYTIYQEMPSAWSEGGGNFLSAAGDTIGSILTDPATIAGLGFGGPIGSILAQSAKQVGKGAATRAVLSHALKNNVGKLSAMTSVEGLLAGMHESQRQEAQKEVGLIAEKDWGDIATSAAIGTGASVVGGVLGARAASKAAASTRKVVGTQTRMEALASRLDSLNVSEEDLLKRDPVTGVPFDEEAATRMRDHMLMPDVPMDAKVQQEVVKRVNRAAFEIYTQSKDLAEQTGDAFQFASVDANKVSDVVLDVMSKLDTIDDDVLEQALERSGLALDELTIVLDDLGLDESSFAQVNRMSVREAARTMQSYSALKRKLNKMGDTNPELKAKLDKYYGKPSSTRGAMSTLYDVARRADRETRAMMVSQISTTARNLMSAAGYLTFGAAAKMMETTLVHTARGVGSLMKGNATIKGSVEGTKDVLSESLGTLASVMGHKDSKQVADLLLKDNPRLQGTLFRTMQETGDKTLSKVTMWMNGLNMAQDTIVRSGVFTQSVDSRMKQLGLNMMDHVAENRPIPVQVLKAATDDALEATFARMPEHGIAKHFVKLTESLPFMPVIGTHAFPFARFMADSMIFQYNYSPLNFFNSASTYVRGAVDIKRSKQALGKNAQELEYAGKALQRESLERFSKASVGSAALAAAVMYREENQDVLWYEMKDTKENKTIDARAIFPITPYLAVADLIVKLKNGETQDLNAFTQLLQGVAGAQFRPGSAVDFVENLVTTIQEVATDGLGDAPARERLGKVFGDWAGSIAGRPLTAGQIFRDAAAMYDDTQALVRETRKAEGEGFIDNASSAFMGHLKSKLPVWQEDLDPYRSITSDKPVRRQSAFMGQLTGMRYMPTRSEVETELSSLGIEAYTLMPSTGNKEADYMMKKHMPTYINMVLGAQIGSTYYKGLTKNEKKLAIKNRMTDVRKLAKSVAEGEAIVLAAKEGKMSTVFDKAKWSKTPQVERKLADEYFMEHYGKTVSELGWYEAGTKIGRALKKSF